MALKDVEHVMADHERELLAIEGVQGIGVGSDDGRPAIKVFVDHDQERYRQLLPRALDDIPVLVEESGVFEAL
jgi:hypothetical protein